MAEEETGNGIYNSILIYYEELAKKWQMFLCHPSIGVYIIKFKEQFVHNPLLQVITFVVIASLLTPIVLFIIFAIITAIIAFIGFMMLQVTVLAIGASILSCVLFSIASIFIMIGLCTLFVYYTLNLANHALNFLTYGKV